MYVRVCVLEYVPSSATDCASAGAEPQGKYERLDITGDIWHVDIYAQLCSYSMPAHCVCARVCVCQPRSCLHSGTVDCVYEYVVCFYDHTEITLCSPTSALMCVCVSNLIKLSCTSPRLRLTGVHDEHIV